MGGPDGAHPVETPAYLDLGPWAVPFGGSIARRRVA